MQKATHQMLELVQSMLDLARIDLGIQLNVEPLILRDLLFGVVDEYKAQAAAKEQALSLAPLDGHPQVSGDGLRLKQALRNLVGNAIKYTPHGGSITVSTEPNGHTICVKVRDTGFGIPASDLPYIFDKFYRVHTEETRDIEGNGLGLAIVKAVMEQHGGQVRVESAVGKGSCFSFTLPLRPAAVH